MIKEILPDFSMMKKQKHPEFTPSTCIVVGPMPFKIEKFKKLIKEGLFDLVYIDGGLVHQKKFKGKAFTTFGDGDSAKEVLQNVKKDQNLSDLAFFLKSAAKKSAKKYDQYLFLGFLGGRLDHELINLGEISSFMHHFTHPKKAKVFLDEKIEFFPKGPFEIDIHGTFSLLSFEKCRLKIKGQCTYEVRSPIHLGALSSRGLSNQGFGVVQISATAPVAIFRS